MAEIKSAAERVQKCLLGLEGMRLYRTRSDVWLPRFENGLDLWASPADTVQNPNLMVVLRCCLRAGYFGTARRIPGSPIGMPEVINARVNEIVSALPSSNLK